ncbi:hypothetical protein ACFLV5_03030 [Chloroflexota bacterium]
MDNLEGNENMITYCGLYCGDCHGYQQKIPDLAPSLALHRYRDVCPAMRTIGLFHLASLYTMV